jgi:hypothetical protein
MVQKISRIFRYKKRPKTRTNREMPGDEIMGCGYPKQKKTHKIRQTTLTKRKDLITFCEVCGKEIPFNLKHQSDVCSLKCGRIIFKKDPKRCVFVGDENNELEG